MITELTQMKILVLRVQEPEPGTSGLEKTAPSGKLEFSSRSK